MALINYLMKTHTAKRPKAALVQKRVTVYEAAKSRRPDRWSGTTRNRQPVHIVYLNPDQNIAEKEGKTEGKTEGGQAVKMAA